MRFTMVFLWCALAFGALVAGAAAPLTVVPEAPAVLVFEKAGMVAVRPLAELCGAKITVVKGVITLTRGEKSFAYSVGKVAAMDNSKAVTLPLAPFIYASVGYVPAEAVLTALGGVAKVSDDQKALAVTFDGAAFSLPMELQMGTPDELRKMSLDIFLVNLDGSRVQQLTYEIMNRTLMNMRTARFTVDGTALLYEKGTDIYRRTLDAANGTSLTAAATKDGMVSAAPLAGPNGSVLCMQLKMNPEGGEPPLPDLNLIAANGEVKKVATGARPQVSQDGKLIAYTAIDKEQKLSTHVVNADGTNDKVLGDGLMSAFSPDGATVLILTPKFTPEGAMESVTVSQVQVADGKALYTEEPLPAVMEGPAYAFSPDSKQLVVAMPRMGLMLMNTDRSGEKTPLTMGPDMAPQFSPDGKTIFFLRDRKLFSVPVAGGEATPVAPNLMALDFCISPDGAQALVVGITEATLAALAPKPPAPKIPTGKFKAPTPAEIAAAKKLGTRTAVIKTVKGDITVELYGKDAPQTVANFVKLATAKFYNGLTFHRIVDGFCVQGGDPNGDGSGDPGYSIKLEIAKNLKHITGSLAMARSQDPDSAGCQFYITPAPQPALDGQYAVFGKVIKGMDVVKKIVKDDKIISITVK